MKFICVNGIFYSVKRIRSFQWALKKVPIEKCDDETQTQNVLYVHYFCMVLDSNETVIDRSFFDSFRDESGNPYILRSELKRAEEFVNDKERQFRCFIDFIDKTRRCLFSFDEEMNEEFLY